MSSTTLKGPGSTPQEPQTSSAYRLPGAPKTVVKPEVIFSEDQYTSSTFHKWFERHTGLSLDEALTLGLAEREQVSQWKATPSSAGT